ncbi:MAG: ATP-binding protein [Pseudomonadota bacterium]
MSSNKDKAPNMTHPENVFDAARKLLDDPARILDNIMMSMGDGLSIQDRNMRIVYQNKFMIDQFGSHIGDYCYNIYEKRSTACDGCPIIESYRTGQVTKALRVGITKEGIPFRFENIASVLRNEHGEIVAGMELCRIVEEREKAFDDLREAMLRLKQMQNQLVRAEKLAGIGQLAAGVAHEINNPAGFVLSNMNTMQKYVTSFFHYVDSMENLVKSAASGDSTAQSIREGVRQLIDSDDYRYLKDDLPEVIKESLDGLQRIKTIVTNLLAFASSSEEGRCMVDVNAEIESALLLLDSEIGKKGHVVKNLGRLPKIFANPQQLKQMFVNLIHNATQAIGPDGRISVSTEEKDNHISIAISDNGIGISANVVPNIFNPFFTTREVGNGVGLGLSIAYRVIEGHNGNVDVQSEPGHGTTYTIRLPIISAKGE